MIDLRCPNCGCYAFYISVDGGEYEFRCYHCMELMGKVEVGAA